MTAKKKAQPKAKAPKLRRRPTSVIVLFGVNSDGEARGGRFPDDDPNNLSAVALAQGLRMVIASKKEHYEAVELLPVCRAGKPGKTNVPKIAKEKLEPINALVGDLGPISPTPAASTSDLTTGHVVLAPADAALDDGYYPALITHRDGDKLVLRWRDEPNLEPFERTIVEVGLVHPITS